MDSPRRQFRPILAASDCHLAGTGTPHERRVTTVAVYLEDHAGDDGGLSIAPGSHRNASVHQETVAALDPSARPGGETREFKKTTPECRKDQKTAFVPFELGRCRRVVAASPPRRRRKFAAASPPIRPRNISARGRDPRPRNIQHASPRGGAARPALGIIRAAPPRRGRDLASRRNYPAPQVPRGLAAGARVPVRPDPQPRGRRGRLRLAVGPPGRADAPGGFRAGPIGLVETHGRDVFVRRE